LIYALKKIYKLDKLKIDILIDNTHSFLNDYIGEIKKILGSFASYKNIRVFKKHSKIKEGDILFILGCDKILSSNSIKKHKLNLVIHPSKLPKGRGGAALFWEILKGKNSFYLTMFDADEKIDNGKIVLTSKIKLKGNELHDEIRIHQAKSTLGIIKKFLKNYQKIEFKKQIGKPSYYPKRTPKDSEININKSIKENFNLLRICSNENYPAFFKYKKKKFIIKIYEEN